MRVREEPSEDSSEAEAPEHCCRQAKHRGGKSVASCRAHSVHVSILRLSLTALCTTGGTQTVHLLMRYIITPHTQGKNNICHRLLPVGSGRDCVRGSGHTAHFDGQLPAMVSARPAGHAPPNKTLLESWGATGPLRSHSMHTCTNIRTHRTHMHTYTQCTHTCTCAHTMQHMQY